MSVERVLEAARCMDQACRELAWWTTPVGPPEHFEDLAEQARAAIREFRRAHHEYNGEVPLPPLNEDEQ